MSEPVARRRLLIGGLTLVLAAAGRRPGTAASKAAIGVHRSPT